MKTHLLLVLAATLCCDPAWANEVTDYLIGTRGGSKLPYRLSLPDDYNKNTKDYPFLIYLHGISGRGSNLKIGAGPSGKHWTEKFIILAPQCPAGQTWWQAPPMDNMKKIVEYEKTQLRVDDDSTRTKLLGFLEPKTVHTITARAPDQAKGEVFAGWTSAGGSAYKHPTHASNTTTHPVKSKGRFGNARALTTTFTMPANDVIITATYKIDSHKETCPDHNEENSNESTAS